MLSRLVTLLSKSKKTAIVITGIQKILVTEKNSHIEIIWGILTNLKKSLLKQQKKHYKNHSQGKLIYDFDNFRHPFFIKIVQKSCVAFAQVTVTTSYILLYKMTLEH